MIYNTEEANLRYQTFSTRSNKLIYDILTQREGGASLDYSNEQKERIFNGIISHVAKTLQEEEVTATVTTGTIENLIGSELTESIVIKNNDYLNNEYGHLAAAYGFTDFYDFYLYAKSCEQNEVSKAGASRQKDLSKLKQVKRTVTRNGKPTEMTFYEDPNKGKKDDVPMEGSEETEEDTAPQPVDAKELRKLSIGNDDERTSTKDLAGIKEFYDSMGSPEPFYSDAGSYTILADENNNVMGVIGFDYGEEFITLVFSQKHELTGNYDIRVFYELVKEGLRKGKGIRLQHLGTSTFDIFVEDHKMNIPEEIDGYYELDRDSLFEVYGYDT